MRHFLFLVFLLLLPIPLRAAEDHPDLAKRLSGRILLQVESYGRAWYVNPTDDFRYYLRDGRAAFEIMRDFGLGISNADLARLPWRRGDYGDKELVERLKGRILLQVEENGEAWYVNPLDGLRYYLKDGAAAYRLMRELSLGISNKDLKKITINDSQLVFDATFDTVAYTKYDNGRFRETSYGDAILPLASLTKLMTALVFYELNPDWQREIVISQDIMVYPRRYVGDDPTSEVAFQAGDSVRIQDLWTAMLLASSNQAAYALAKASGLAYGDFVDKMNQKARELELKSTKFYEVAGLDAHNVSTPKEMAMIARLAFSIPKIAETTALTTYNILAKDKADNPKIIPTVNRNYSLLKFQPQAAKTGFLVEAQRNVALGKNNAIIVVMHALSMRQRNNIITRLLK